MHQVGEEIDLIDDYSSHPTSCDMDEDEEDAEEAARARLLFRKTVGSPPPAPQSPPELLQQSPATQPKQPEYATVTLGRKAPTQELVVQTRGFPDGRVEKTLGDGTLLTMFTNGTVKEMR